MTGCGSKRHYEFAESRIGACPPAPGKVTTISIPGGFDEPRQLMGEENLALACYEETELLHDILRSLGETVGAAATDATVVEVGIAAKCWHRIHGNAPVQRRRDTGKARRDSEWSDARRCRRFEALKFRLSGSS